MAGFLPSLNPLFIRSSIPFRRPPAELWRGISEGSQSLIHQVIYSVRGNRDDPAPALGCLNPLFIRSSIPLGISEGRLPDY